MDLFTVTRSKLISFITLLLISTSTFADDPAQLWPAVAFNTKFDNYKLSTYLEYRAETSEAAPRLELVSQKISRSVSKHWQAGINLTYIRYRSNVDLPMKYMVRMEPEVNQSFMISKRIKFAMRNRVEFRWIENGGFWQNTQSRHRLGLSFPFNGSKIVKGLVLQNEVFYYYKESRVKENRFTPIGVVFQFRSNFKTTLFYLIQSKKGPKDTDVWQSTNAIGTFFTLAL